MNEYHRLSVSEFVESFCGWAALTELVGMAKSERDRAFLAALFLTGGRAREALSLSKSNFEIREADGLILVRNMPLEKRYKKVEQITKADGSLGWRTEKMLKFRKPFPIVLKEPLAPVLTGWIEKSSGPLFPSPYKPESPLSRHWAYHMIRELDEDLPVSLRERLGVNRPFVAEGVKLAPHIHLWTHWFRSQRASQLVENYNYATEELIDYFSWEHYKTALTYAKRGWRGLAAKMQSPVAYI